VKCEVWVVCRSVCSTSASKRECLREREREKEGTTAGGRGPEVECGLELGSGRLATARRGRKGMEEGRGLGNEEMGVGDGEARQSQGALPVAWMANLTAQLSFWILFEHGK